MMNAVRRGMVDGEREERRRIEELLSEWPGFGSDGAIRCTTRATEVGWEVWSGEAVRFGGRGRWKGRVEVESEGGNRKAGRGGAGSARWGRRYPPREKLERGPARFLRMTDMKSPPTLARRGAFFK